jgi:hypothetical protein
MPWLALIACALAGLALFWFSTRGGRRTHERQAELSSQGAAAGKTNLPPPESAPNASRAAAATAVQAPSLPPASARAAFNEWAHRYLTAAPEQRAALENEGIRLAQARRPEVKSLIVNDPRQALAEAVPMVVRQQLPASVVPWLERRVADTGTLRVYLSTPPPDHAVVAGNTAPTAPGSSSVTPAPGMQIVATGVAGNAVPSAGASPAGTAPMAAGARITGRSSGAPGPAASQLSAATSDVTLPLPNTPLEQIQPPILRYAELRTGETLRARVYGRHDERVTWVTGASLNGIAIDEEFAVNESPIRPLEIGEIPDPHKPAVEVCPVSNIVTEAATAAAPITEAIPAVEAFGQIVYLCDGSHTVVYERMLLQGEGATGGPQQFTGILPAGPTPSVGTIKVLYIPVTFADQNTVPSSEATAYEVLRKVNDFYNKASFGKLTMVGVVTPPVKLPHDEAWYKQKDTSDGSPGNKEIDGLGLEHSHAREEARKLGYDSNDYSCIVVRLNGGPRATGGWGGGASVWIYGDSEGITAHEIGHVFGLAHANFWDTGGASAIGPGANQEYGDQYDNMGSSGSFFPKNHYNAQAKSQIRWLPADFIQTITSSGTYRLYAFDQASLRAGQRYAFKVVKDTQRTYWGEFRGQHEGTNNWAANGLLLGWNWPTNSGSNLQLIDTTPGSPGAKDDAAIYLGRTFSDFESGIHFTTVAVNPGDPKSLDVVVNLGMFPGNRAPSLSVSSTASNVPVNLHRDGVRP